ncbi:MAG: TAXI family TRAP transporter solute-binding subunit [Pseudomonadota bacterium]
MGVAACALSAATAGAVEPEQRTYVIATASKGGVYYPVGAALAALARAQTPGLRVEAVVSAGSVANVDLLNDDAAQFAIIQGLAAGQARIGADAFADRPPRRDLRAIGALWPNVEQFVIRRSAVDTGTIADLVALRGRGVRAALGSPKSGALNSNRALLASFGVDVERDFTLVDYGYADAARALRDGRIDVMSAPSGLPSPAVADAFGALGDDLAILSFAPAQQATANSSSAAARSLWRAHVIPAGLYPSVDEDVPTLAQPNLLVTHARVDEGVVYQMTRVIYENIAALEIAHRATAALNVETALAALPIPLHAGARRFYRELGITRSSLSGPVDDARLQRKGDSSR